MPLTSTTARWFVVPAAGLMTGHRHGRESGLALLLGPPDRTSALISGYDWRVAYLILGTVVLVGVTLAAQLPAHAIPAQMGTDPVRGRTVSAVRTPDSGRPARGRRLSTRPCTRASSGSWSLAFLCYGFSLSAILLHLAPHAADLGIPAASAASLIADDRRGQRGRKGMPRKRREIGSATRTCT